MIAHKTISSGISCRSLRAAVPSRPAAAAPSRRSVVAHYIRDEEKQPFDIEQIEQKLEEASSRPTVSPTQTKLSPEQMEEVIFQLCSTYHISACVPHLLAVGKSASDCLISANMVDWLVFVNIPLAIKAAY